MEEINKIPPVTRTLIFASLGITLPCMIKVLSPYLFILLWPKVYREVNFWRPITAFFFGGTQPLQFLFDMFMLFRNSSDLELNKFYRKTSDYAWALILINTMILVTNYPLGSVVLFSPFTMAIVYLWARANEHASVNLFGFINCPAKYLPYVYLGFDLVRGGLPAAIQSATGILSAHIYYFLREILPATNGGRGPRYLPGTPLLLQRLLPDSLDPNARGQTPQPGGSVRSTGWGGTAFAPAGRSFGDEEFRNREPPTGGQRLDSQGSRGGGITSWLPFGRGSQRASTLGGSASGNTSRNVPDREAMLAAAEARLRSLRDKSIAGQNQAASAAASQAANSAEARARSSKPAAAGSATGASSFGKDGATSSGVQVRGVAGLSTARKPHNKESADSEEQETASSSGGRVAEIQRAPSSNTQGKQKDDGQSESQEYAWGSGKKLSDA